MTHIFNVRHLVYLVDKNDGLQLLYLAIENPDFSV